MPTRKFPFIIGNHYHTFNQFIDGRRIFADPYFAKHFYNRLVYYRSSKTTHGFEHLKRLNEEVLLNTLKEVSYEKYHLVKVLAYKLMPTHFHLVLQQLVENGISKYLSNVANSFTRFYNIKTERKGQVFLKDFKAVEILSDEQLLHTVRYTHLNASSSGLIDISQIRNQPWCSHKAYVSNSPDKLVDTKPILDYFKRDKREFEKFVLDNAEYQKELEMLKYLEEF